jgi:DNA invertase Pin-like site-specific DNA recombinase
MVYTILEPDKPGDLIQKLRYEKVKELRKEGKTAREIATFTGLSDSYIRKIWNAL